jgi:solute carrier family 39 (zinc transporter), member 9
MNLRMESWQRAGTLLALLGIGAVLAGCQGAVSGEGTGSAWSFALMVAGITFMAAFFGGAMPLLGRVNHEHKLLGVFTSVSAGFLISAACLIVIPEGFERYAGHSDFAVEDGEVEAGHEGHDHAESEDDHDHDHDHGGGHHAGSFGLDPSITGGLAILLGFLLMLVTESLGFGHDIHEEHHHDSGGHVHHPVGAVHGKRLAAIVVIGLTIHTIADGMAIGAGLATGSQALTGSLVATLLTHKVPAAFSLTVFSQHAHGNIRRTWLDLLIFSAATPLAIMVTWLVLGNLSDQMVGLVLLFSAGTFIYVATIDVLPNVLQTNRRRQAAFHVIIGCVSLLALIVLLESLGLSLHDHG